MPFNLFYHHRLEKLAEGYLSHRQGRLGDFREGGVLGREVVVVPTYGVAVWLEHYLVRRGVVSAGIDFPVLRIAVSTLLEETVEGYVPQHFTSSSLAWRIFAVFEQRKDDPDFPVELKNYLFMAGENDSRLRMFEFAKVVAKLFEEYQSYLPATLACWGRGEKLSETICERDGRASSLGSGLRWQSWLWHCICNPESGVHLKSLAEAMDEFRGASRKPTYPITVFGASAMPPAFLKVLRDYSATATVNFYYRNPSREYWGDNVESWRQRVEEEVPFQNDLLANCAVQAREFFEGIVDLVPNFGGEPMAGEISEDESIVPRTLLRTIQEQIVANVNPPEAQEDRLDLSDADDSLSIHSCFNATREVEALRDSLLLLLKRHQDTFQMNDIIVMAPDISAYASAIHAVFDNSPLRRRYTISDRSIRKANLLAEGFLEILEFPSSRFEVSRVIRLLDVQPLRNRFELTDEDVIALRGWLNAVQIRLDADLDSRMAEFHLHDEAYTWQQGLDRLLLSLAVEVPPEESQRTLGFGELAPQPFASSGDAHHALGSLCMLFRLLRATVDELKAEPAGRTAQEWRELLLRILQRFFVADEASALDHFTLRNCIAEMANNAIDGGYAGKLPFSVVQTVLNAALESAAPKEPFLNGKITCCSMMPMREVPCKVLAVLGMDAGAFPHRDAEIGFTLLTRGTKLPYYVRSRIQEDRYIFLEALEAVSDYLLIFYHGQDDKNPDGDSSILPPASLVGELLDYAARACRGMDQEKIRKALVVRHRLNAFDAKNYRQDNQSPATLRAPFSFDAMNLRVALVKPDASPQATRGYFDLPMPPELPFAVQNGATSVEIREVESFFRHAVGSFLRRRMNLSSVQKSSPLKDKECFAIDEPLLAVKLKEEIFQELWLAEKPGEENVNRIVRDSDFLWKLQRTSRLPLGDLAARQLRSIEATMERPAEAELDLWRRQEIKDLHVTVELPADLLAGLPNLRKLRQMNCCLEVPGGRMELQLHGQIQMAAGGAGILDARHGSYHHKHFVLPYLRWLMLAAQPGGCPRPFLKLLMTKDSGKVREPLKAEVFQKSNLADYARLRLAKLLQLYLLGHFIPLPLFYDTCFRLQGKKSRVSVLKSLTEANYGAEYLQEPDHELVFGTAESVEANPLLLGAMKELGELVFADYNG